MRAIFLILLLAVLAFGGWLLWGATPPPQPVAPHAVTQSVATLSTPRQITPPAQLNPPSAVTAGALDPPAVPTEQATAGADPVDPASPLPPAGQAIQNATLDPPAKGAKPTSYDPVLLKAEVLLDRAGFSPGVIDGRDGDNVRRALTAFARAQGAPADGSLSKTVFEALTTRDAAPVMQAYRITKADVAGPFIGDIPTDYRQLSKLPAHSYSTPLQLLGEKFHMDQALLKALNPGAAFDKAGTVILVAAPRTEPRDFQAARIEVDKTDNVLRAYGADGKLVAVYPASVGSVERPAPSGAFEVKAVAPRPAYFYDPARLTFAPEGATGKLKIAPGPNNPVGSTWIALTIPTYGIHGAPDPTLIGKRQSHGCVRLTNWDAIELGRAVKKGVKVDFIGAERAARKKA